MVAHIPAMDVLITVPSSWKKLRSPNSKWLLDIIITIASLIAFIEKTAGNFGCVASLLSQVVITSIAWLVSMLLYIETASAVKTYAFGGRSWMAWSSCMMWEVSWT